MTTCALVGTSEFNAKAFMQMDAEGLFDIVIAVDGGYNYLKAIDRRPDIVLGDFDSLEKKPSGVRKITYPAKKDKSDMELALEHARKINATNVFVFGALGMRLDHTLANLQVLAKFCEDGGEVVAIGTAEQVYFAAGPSVLEFEARADTTISVFAFSDYVRGLFERGLEWELDNAELSARTSLGLSNKFIGKAALVGVESGTIAVFLLEADANE